MSRGFTDCTGLEKYHTRSGSRLRTGTWKRKTRVLDGGSRSLTLSVTCNFMNLNQTFEAVAGTHSRSLFVYSDVGGSSVVGNQVTDLLREVNFLSISNPSTFNIFHHASRCWTLSRRKWQRPGVNWRDLAKEIRSSPYSSA